MLYVIMVTVKSSTEPVILGGRSYKTDRVARKVALREQKKWKKDATFTIVGIMPPEDSDTCHTQ